jgi:hypothetical protein
MKRRGKVLRDPLADPGLLSVDGRHYPFLLEGVWQSEAPPKPGLPVDVEFDPEGKIRAITVVPDSELDKAQAEMARSAGQRQGVLASLASRFGFAGLVAAGLLAVSWLFLVLVR